MQELPHKWYIYYIRFLRLCLCWRWSGAAQEDGVWSAEREHEIRAEGGTGVKTRATTAWARFERSTTVPQPKALSLN
ncbi:hypothetical protein GYH30_043865 [Glycine max]|nr:hypothetical protein GYH30_043865 [Glycine max]